MRHRFSQRCIHLVDALRVPDDGRDNQNDEHHQYDGKVCSEHALVLLPCSTATEKRDNDDEEADDNQENGSAGVQSDGFTIAISYQITDVLAHSQHIDTNAQNSTSHQLRCICDN